MQYFILGMEKIMSVQLKSSLDYIFIYISDCCSFLTCFWNWGLTAFKKTKMTRAACHIQHVCVFRCNLRIRINLNLCYINNNVVSVSPIFILQWHKSTAVKNSEKFKWSEISLLSCFTECRDCWNTWARTGATLTTCAGITLHTRSRWETGKMKITSSVPVNRLCSEQQANVLIDSVF